MLQLSFGCRALPISTRPARKDFDYKNPRDESRRARNTARCSARSGYALRLGPRHRPEALAAYRDRPLSRQMCSGASPATTAAAAATATAPASAATAAATASTATASPPPRDLLGLDGRDFFAIEKAERIQPHVEHFLFAEVDRTRPARRRSRRSVSRRTIDAGSACERQRYTHHTEGFLASMFVLWVVR